MTVHIGTSGFMYKHWRGVLYPEKMPVSAWLEHYAVTFSCVEINSTFYHLPALSTAASWADRTPARFLFVLKGSRTVTHIRKLAGAEASIALFHERAAAMGAKLGAVLWQVPPMLHRNAERLDRFLAALPPDPPVAIEFRDPSWYDEEIYRILRRRHAAFCIHDMTGSATPDVITAPLVYLRFHGTDQRYGGSYPDDALAATADWIRRCGGRTVMAFFNNDIGGHAVRNAQTLAAMLR